MSMRYGQQPIGSHARAMPLRRDPIPPKTSSKDKDSPVASLCQVIAMAMCYRRLGFIFLVLPAACIFAPIAINGVLGALNSTTQGAGFFCFTLVFASTMAWNRQIKRYAPSPEKLQEALQKSQVIVPLASFVFSCAILRIFSESTKSLRWTPSIAWDIGIRPAIGLALINAALLFRFVGPGSMFRCSTVPLASNGYFNWIRLQLVRILPFRNNWRRTAPNAAPNAAAAAGDASMLRKSGRRFQCPTLPSYGANMLVTCIFGYIVAEYILLPYFDFGEVKRSRRFIHDFTCVLTMVLHLWIPYFNGTGHELNPKNYSNQAPGGNVYPAPISGRALKDVAKRQAMVTTIIIVIGMAIGVLCKYLFESSIDKDVWLVLHCIAMSLVLGFYAAAVEEAAKASLFVGSRLQRFVLEVTSGNKANGDSSITLQEEESFVVDAALHSLLHGDTTCVVIVSEPTVSNQQLETYEAGRNNTAVATMANALVGKQDAKRPREVALEEDVLRISLLEALGGTSPLQPTAKANNNAAVVVWEKSDPYPLGNRHRKNIEYWVTPPTTRQGVVVPMQNGNPATNEPKGILLTRALSAFAGGLGQALTECSTSYTYPTTWLLRPGAICAAEYSVIALSRIFLVYFEHSKKTATDFRLLQLSSLIPAALNSIFRLHVGILKYAEYLGRLLGQSAPWPQTTSRGANIVFTDVNAHFAKDHPDLHRVLHAVEEAAKTIMKQLGDSYDARQHAIDFDCREWLVRVRKQNSY